jgi:hypothetical protein
MHNPLNSEQRLALLAKSGSIRPWKSCHERRRCVACDRVFQGFDIRISARASGVPRLRCPTPGCHSGPEMWVHPGDPLISEEAWNDWELLVKAVEASEAKSATASA